MSYIVSLISKTERKERRKEEGKESLREEGREREGESL